MSFLTILKSINFAETNTFSMRYLLLEPYFSPFLQAQDKLFHWQNLTHMFPMPLSQRIISVEILRDAPHFHKLRLGRIRFFYQFLQGTHHSHCVTKRKYLRRGSLALHLMAGTAYGYKKNLYNYPTIPLSGTILI